MPGTADDGINRTRLNAQGAANAQGFVYQRNGKRALVAVCRIEWPMRLIQYHRDLANAGVAPGGALIQVGGASGKGFGIGPAASIAALGALCLRQDCVDARSQFIIEIIHVHALQAAHNFTDNTGSTIDKAAIQLQECCAGVQFFARVLRTHDASDANDG